MPEPTQGVAAKAARLSLAALNRLPRAEFTASLAHIFEHSAWIPDQTSTQAPFASVEALHAAMVRVVGEATPEQQLALLQAHPELAARQTLTAESAAEQQGAGLTRLSTEHAADLGIRNSEYRARFGFPFIIAVRGARDVGAILQAVESRLSHTREQEVAEALRQVARIARFRLDDLVAEGRVTTHVLDTASGGPAAGLALTLDRLDGGSRIACGQFATNADGRCDVPLIAAADMAEGEYEVMFDVAGWRRANDLDPGFYDHVPIRFRITDPGAHYHVPLILAPYGYSTYRGS